MTMQSSRDGRAGFAKTGTLDVIALVGLGGLVLIFNPDLAFRGMVLSGYDTFAYFYPLRSYFAASIAEGRFPLWNPHLFLGVPYLANPQTAVFYPGTWLFTLVDVPRAYALNFMGHLYLAAAGVYLFARKALGLGMLASLVGGASFAFSGYLSGQSGHLNQLSAAAWLPFLALALDVVLRTRSFTAFAALIAGLVCQIFAGHPQQVQMSVVVLAVVVVWRRARSGLRSLASGLAMLGVATALAAGLTAVQLLPTLELARASIRGGGLDYQQALFGALPWPLLLPALLPGYWSHLHTTELFGHLGTVMFVLAWLGLVAGCARAAALGGLLVAVGLSLAVGDALPLYPLLFEWVPGFGSFRVPSRWLFAYTFGASILVAAGLHWAAHGPLRDRVESLPDWGRALLAGLSRARLMLFGVGVPIGLGLVALAGQPQSRRLLLVWGLLGLLTVTVVLVVRASARGWRPSLAGLAVIALADLWIAGSGLEHRLPIPDLPYAQPRESTLFLRTREELDGRFRVLSIATPEYEFRETPEYRERFDWLTPGALMNLLVAVKWNEALVPNVPLVYRLDSADGYDGGVLPLARFVRLVTPMVGADRVRPDGVLASRLDSLPADRWLDLLGVRFVLASRIKDLTHDGLYFDRSISVALRPGERLDLRGLPLGEFTRLGMLSSWHGASAIGGEVGRLELEAGPGTVTAIPLVDGVHTAGDRRVTDPSAPAADAPQLERFQAWSADSPSDPADWLAELRFARQPVTRLSIVNTSTDRVLQIGSLNLVDDVRQASFSLTLDDRIERTEFFDMKVYDRRDALARAYFIGRADVLDDAAAIDVISDPDFRPRERVVLAPDGGVAAPGQSSATGEATIELSQPEQVRARVRSTGPGILVLSDSWYPGWRALVDGQEVPIARANVLFRGVAVPAGDHVVEFRYEPASFRLGVAISILSIAATVGLGWLVGRYERRGRA